MDEHAPENKQRSGLVWLLVLIALVVVWVFFRPAGLTESATQTRSGDDNNWYAEGADPDDIIVDLVDDADADTVTAIERDLGIELELVSSQSYDERFYKAHVDANRRDAILTALVARPEVEIAEPNAVYQLSPPSFGQGYVLDTDDTQWEGFPDDPKYKYQWHLDQVRMPAAWKLADGESVIVAVLDTGVAYEKYDHFTQVPDLAGVEFVKPYNFIDDNRHANDDHGHGTHVTGTIAQTTNNGVGVAGVARNVRIMPLKVLSGSGSGTVAGIADAIRYAADEGAHVINMSLGGPFPSRALEKAVKYAHKKGVVVVCAAGNDGRSKVGYPAAYPGALAVAATQYDETTTFYSNYGKHIDIAAPGGNTRVDQNGDGQPDGVLQNTIATNDPTQNDYFGYMGTSMAAPHVAGIAALVVGEGITNPTAVEKILEETARHPKSQQYDKKRYGAGIIDAEAAILKARSGAGGMQLLLGLFIAAGAAFSVRKRSSLLRPGFLGGVLFGASGLFFLPYIAGGISSWPVVEALTRGLPSMGLGVLGVSAHSTILTFSALLPLVLVALLLGVPKARLPLAGLAAGVAGHLAFHAVAGITDVRWMPDMLDAAWLGINAVLCFALARLVLRRR